jgi:hypothetical protein
MSAGGTINKNCLDKKTVLVLMKTNNLKKVMIKTDIFSAMTETNCLKLNYTKQVRSTS